MSAVVPLLAEALSLAITEHPDELAALESHHAQAVWYLRNPRESSSAAMYNEMFSAGVEALAVALHARLQEQGTLT